MYMLYIPYTLQLHIHEPIRDQHAYIPTCTYALIPQCGFFFSAGIWRWSSLGTLMGLVMVMVNVFSGDFLPPLATPSPERP